jgi:hypothetical protein
MRSSLLNSNGNAVVAASGSSFFLGGSRCVRKAMFDEQLFTHRQWQYHIVLGDIGTSVVL